MIPLAELIARRNRLTWPLTAAEFMAEALGHTGSALPTPTWHDVLIIVPC